MLLKQRMASFKIFGSLSKGQQLDRTIQEQHGSVFDHLMHLRWNPLPKL